MTDFIGGGGRNRTGVHGFAGRCMTTLPPRHCCPNPMGWLNRCAAQSRNLKAKKGKRISAKAHEFHTMALCERIHFPCNWSGKRGSNSRPQPWQGCALPLSYSREIQSRHYKDASIFVKKGTRCTPRPFVTIMATYIHNAYERPNKCLNQSTVFQRLWDGYFQIVGHRP